MEPLLTVLFVVFIYFLFRESNDSTDNSPYKQPRLTDEEHKQRKFDRDVQAILDRPSTVKQPISLHSIFTEPALTTPREIPTFIFSPLRESNQFMSREDKLAHMCSDFWKELKAQRLVIANYTCEVPGCTNTAHLECHHLDYSNLGAEEIEDVVMLCRKCHQAQHDAYGYGRTILYYPIITPK